MNHANTKSQKTVLEPAATPAATGKRGETEIKVDLKGIKAACSRVRVFDCIVSVCAEAVKRVKSVFCGRENGGTHTRRTVHSAFKHFTPLPWLPSTHTTS